MQCVIFRGWPQCIESHPCFDTVGSATESTSGLYKFAAIQTPKVFWGLCPHLEYF